MNNFIYTIPTTVYFGKGQIENIGVEAAKYGKNTLIVYGGGSVKKNGIFSEAVKFLEAEGAEIFELGGVEPNPKIETVAKGANICREKSIDVIIPIGGGSTIDCAKAIAAAAKYNGEPWDIVVDPDKIEGAIPVIAVLTLAATGSEMDKIAVISNMKINEKIGTRNEHLRPVAAILDPTYTMSVSKYQTGSGSADIMSHILESYFSNVNSFIHSRVCEALMKTVIEFGPKAIDEPENYEARANLMWASSWAINDFLKLGNEVGWSVHPMEHELSAFYDITHGVGLAILTPYWMRKVLSDNTVDKFCEYAHNVWEINYEEDKFAMANKGIAKTEEFFEKLGMPKTLTEVGIDEENLSKMAEKCVGRLAAGYVPLTVDEIEDIFRSAL